VVQEKTWGCLKQTAIGCGGLIVLAIAFPIVMALMIMGPFNRALDARSTLEDRFGPQESYIPPATGAPAPDRIETFLEIRHALVEPCADLTRVEEQVSEMERFDEQDEVDKMEVMREALSLTRGMMGVGSVLGKLYEIRNQTLLDSGMGLGEFSYIFVVAYGDRLLDQSETGELFGPSATNRRVRKALLSMLENQLEVLRSGGGSETEIATLEGEIAAMEEDDNRIPWQDGIPPVISNALAPYREELDELYCPAMAPLELMINEKRGPAIESR
jgi:hypothetical protein